MITHLLFDLDNTLYSASLGLERNVSRRLETYISGLLNISHEASEQTHRDLIQKKGYGTTLEWLMTEKGFTDIESYYAALYPPCEVDSLPPDPELAAFLRRLPQKKAILTNSPREHVKRVLDRLDIANHFGFIFDIRFNRYKGKPHKEAFFRALDAMGAEMGSTLFIDDYPEFAGGFQAIGGKALLLDEFDRYPQYQYQRIRSLYDIEAYCLES